MIATRFYTFFATTGIYYLLKIDTRTIFLYTPAYTQCLHARALTYLNAAQAAESYTSSAVILSLSILLTISVLSLISSTNWNTDAYSLNGSAGVHRLDNIPATIVFVNDSGLYRRYAKDDRRNTDVFLVSLASLRSLRATSVVLIPARLFVGQQTTYGKL